MDARTSGVETMAVERRGETASAALLETLLTEARALRASHLHLDPEPDGATLWFRIDGALKRHRRLSPSESVQMRQAIHGLSDPAMSDGDSFRESSLPVADGERLVVRLGSGCREDPELEALGTPATLVHALRIAITGAGLILIAGPPRSGRSTTLRALIQALESRPASRFLLERVPGPRLPGVVHVPIADEAGMTDALRGALAQDPDMLAVDPLASREAALHALAAAQAGQLVLAVLDAPDAVAALRQFREWRIDRFDLASTFRVALAQRTVRRLCDRCRSLAQAEGSVAALLGCESGAIVYTPVGCDACEDGYVGQTGVFEAVIGDAGIRRLINDGGDDSILARHAFLRAPTLGSAARRMVRDGVTTPDEAIRVSRG